MRHDVQESGQGEHKANQEENNMRISSDSQVEEEEATRLDVPPWQADFNFEDVFKPVATRGQRSVRRSLRNQSCNSEGLAWVPWTSPEESRRRSRGRRLSAAPPVQPPVPEETVESNSQNLHVDTVNYHSE